MTDVGQQLKPSNEDRRNPIASISIRNVGISMTHGVRRLEVTGSATSVDWVETSFMRVQIHEGYSAFTRDTLHSSADRGLRQLTLQMGGSKGTQCLCHLQP